MWRTESKSEAKSRIEANDRRKAEQKASRHRFVIHGVEPEFSYGIRSGSAKSMKDENALEGVIFLEDPPRLSELIMNKQKVGGAAKAIKQKWTLKSRGGSVGVVVCLFCTKNGRVNQHRYRRIW